jgi:hypothetical protein
MNLNVSDLWTTQYAKEAVAGSITVSNKVQQACKRHLRDLEHPKITNTFAKISTSASKPKTASPSPKSPLAKLNEEFASIKKWTRNTLDISAVPILKNESYLPVFVDVTHSTGRRGILLPYAKAPWPLVRTESCWRFIPIPQ